MGTMGISDSRIKKYVKFNKIITDNLFTEKEMNRLDIMKHVEAIERKLVPFPLGIFNNFN